MTELTTWSPVQIDTELAKLDGEYNLLLNRRAAAISSLHSRDGQRKVYRTRKGEWPTDDAATVLSVRGKLERGELTYFDKQQAEQSLEKLEQAEQQMNENRAACEPFEAEYERRPWQRFFAVEGGHIHAGMWCAGGSIRWNTRRGWRPELANASVEQAIAELKSALCTKCFPGAPVAGKRVDPNACPGTSYVAGTFRNRYPSGYAECSVCHTNQTVTSTGKVRKHRKP